MDIHQEIQHLVDATDRSLDSVTEPVSEGEFVDIVNFLEGTRHCTVSGFVYNNAGELLFVRHEDEIGWLPPGGMVEPGESIETACIREIREESGVDAVVEEPRYIRRGTYVNGDNSVAWYVVKLLCQAIDPTTGTNLGIEGEPIIDARWFDDIPEPLHELARRDHLEQAFNSIN